MWLKIVYNTENIEENNFSYFSPNCISVSLEDSNVAPVNDKDSLIRLSNIFPLMPDSNYLPDLHYCDIYFYDYVDPYRILSKINQKSSQKLKERLFFSTGACAIILFSEDQGGDELNDFENKSLRAHEIWQVREGLISNIKPHFQSPIELDYSPLKDYSSLNFLLRSLFDESVVSIQMLKDKARNAGDPTIIKSLISSINEFIEQLVYLNDPDNHEKPKSLFITNNDKLKDSFINGKLQHQIIDRLIQVNSTLSYVSTQTYSGSIPILERRSLIRRNSLLGIGTAIKALNRIVDYIDNAFSQINFLEIITKKMHKMPHPIDGVRMVYDKSTWDKYNVDKLAETSSSTISENIRKMAYFSSRHAFRESEYSISASLNSVYAGLSLEWNFMTITHEMLHSHVRVIIASIFFDENNSYSDFYNKFEKKFVNKNASNYSAIDSIREIIFLYCCGVIEYGSITDRKPYKDIGDIYCLSEEQLFHTLQVENRNINEIFVHILDFHYFYEGRTANYILLIWCSWSPIPLVHADIRQYILRSLLIIASKINQDRFERWEIAIERFKTIITNNVSITNQYPIFSKVQEILNDKDELKNYYYPAFRNSLILVDLIMNIFYSQEVSSTLWSDDNVIKEPSVEGNDEYDDEYIFYYNVEGEFSDVPIKCPIPYLFDRLIKNLQSNNTMDDIERQTTVSFLAMNSN